MSIIKVGALQDLNGNTELDLVNNSLNVTSVTTTNINGTAATNLIVPPGIVMFFASTSAPTGWIKANGAAISRSAYASLFSVIGTTFGIGDGSTTFNIPDLRGYFPRGFDDGAGVDSGRTFGSIQSDTFASHTHVVNGVWITSGGANIVTTAGSSLNPSSVTTTSTGGSETRPKNIALLACIKF